MYKSYISTLVGFTKGQVQVEGTMTLQLTIDSQLCVKIMEINFLIISNYNSVYNAILGRPSLN